VLDIQDVGDYARLQRIVFPYYNSSQLGQRFCEAMFTEYASRDDTLALGAWKGSQLVGLITAGHRDVESEIQKGLVKKAIFAAMVRPRLWWRPDVVRRVQQLLRSKKNQGESAVEDVSPDKTWIKFVTMGIHEDARRMGLMTLLTSTLSAEAWNRGYRHAELTVFKTNWPQRRCVEKMGWTAGPEPEGEGSVRYTIDLGEQ